MPESIEATYLRTHWDEENLGLYRDQWVAVLGKEIIESGESLEQLLATISRLELPDEPLFAFIYFGDLQ